MKKWFFPVILMIAAGLVCGAFFSCDTGEGDKGPSTTTYTGKDTARKEYKINVTGDRYELMINGELKSTGKVSKDGDTLTLTPDGDPDSPFTVTVQGNLIIGWEGDITDNDGVVIPCPDIQPPFERVAGTWTWYTSDDSKENGPEVGPAFVNPQTIFAPGGASRITNEEDTTAPDGGAAKKPFEYPANSQKDNNGNTITVPVYNFTGTTKVTSNNRTANEGARFPLVGWEAIPDPATLELLKTVYGYSFWVKLNEGTTGDSWAFTTAVVTDYPPEKGYEYRHWFGNATGDSGGSTTPDYTGPLEPGKWHQITVVLDKTDPTFNMEQARWMIDYYSTGNSQADKDAKDKPYDQSKAEKLQWQIPLQHQKKDTGVSARGGNPYDIIRGSYDFNVDFYGLELLKK